MLYLYDGTPPEKAAAQTSSHEPRRVSGAGTSRNVSGVALAREGDADPLTVETQGNATIVVEAITVPVPDPGNGHVGR